jgi:hypothetical protein
MTQQSVGCLADASFKYCAKLQFLTYLAYALGCASEPHYGCSGDHLEPDNG